MVDDIDALYKEFIERGTKIDCGLCDQPYGCREFDTQDIETTISGSGKSFLDRLGFVLMLKDGQRRAEPKCPLRPDSDLGVSVTRQGDVSDARSTEITTRIVEVPRTLLIVPDTSTVNESSPIKSGLAV